MSRLDLTIENGKISDYTHRLIEIRQDIDEPDAEVDAQVQLALNPFREELQVVVGETRAPLDRGMNLESTMEDLLLSALLEHTGPQMAFSNGWRYGAPFLPGPVCVCDLYNMVPMNPPVSIVEISLLIKILTLRLPLQNPQVRRILERECLLKPETWAKSCGKRHPFSEIAYFAILEKGPGVEDLIPDSG